MSTKGRITIKLDKWMKIFEIYEAGLEKEIWNSYDNFIQTASIAKECCLSIKQKYTFNSHYRNFKEQKRNEFDQIVNEYLEANFCTYDHPSYF